MGIRPYGHVPGGAGDHKGRPYVLGPPGVPVGAAFMAARSVRSPGCRSGNAHGRGRMWASAPADVCPAGRATTRVAPTCWGRPVFLLGWPLWPPVLSDPQGPEREYPRQRADMGIRPYGHVPGGAGDHKGRPYVLGPPGVPVGAAFMAARSVRSPGCRSGNAHGRGRMWASAPADVCPAGRATTRVAPTRLGRPAFL